MVHNPPVEQFRKSKSFYFLAFPCSHSHPSNILRHESISTLICESVIKTQMLQMFCSKCSLSTAKYPWCPLNYKNDLDEQFLSVKEPVHLSRFKILLICRWNLTLSSRDVRHPKTILTLPAGLSSVSYRLRGHLITSRCCVEKPRGLMWLSRALPKTTQNSVGLPDRRVCMCMRAST